MTREEIIINRIHEVFEGFDKHFEDALGEGGDWHLHYKVGKVVGNLEQELKDEVIEALNEYGKLN